ncbi:MAG: DUF5908 family protein [Bacteroidota bacterium]
MPLEIKELHIKVNVESTSGNEGRDRPARLNAQASPNLDQHSIIAACIEQIMEILKEKSED